jgi:hypothetical protein
MSIAGPIEEEVIIGKTVNNPSISIFTFEIRSVILIVNTLW